MSKRTVIDCDGCGKKDVAAKPISLTVDRRMDGAGSMENWYETVDLCPDCTREALICFTGKLGYDEAQDWVKVWTVGKRKGPHV